MKVAAPHLRFSNSNSTKEVFPLQVKSPSQASNSSTQHHYQGIQSQAALIGHKHRKKLLELESVVCAKFHV
ncbi:hypothetical protein PIB30_029965 [Stylosanthes scabra]|uniref:Uncharacterized protein n=1 Tax=Stylosanthes scabra TaxID=79078 RepID=A0ABU6X9I9_9FABA|nr:hypothetical protein [Stylosanthes scabra]